ncbi:RnfABCDGE type electron transport complex subunit D [Tindallia californiensis]|uniref:Ion-translocating oxidoreductase complex subunit D n=1 Tax=Tindallia californiensis TaxID=159292 RepID=A0A1H3NAW4_9FIRM|nr:RnfABCDGE type electron transport complex subunit D [Tindallia californiensis]SDY86081.1 electron transport complex protein RnfD [Tindallia californiensis]
MEQKLVVSSSPHIRDNNTVSKVMSDVFIALIPASIGAVYFFRTRALLIMVVAVITAVLAEAAVQKIRKQPVTINDMSAVVTGLLIALNLSPAVAWWIPAIGSAFAIVVVKQFFGGLGKNFMNPALAARILLTLSWTDRMTEWVSPGVDMVSTATPLSFIKGEVSVPSGAPSLFDTFIGNIGGCMGETSALLLLLGGVYLLYRKVISYHIPVIYIGTVALLTLVYGGFDMEYMLYHVMSGGLMIGAIYMATDYASSPLTIKGKIVYAIGCGLLTATIRVFGGYNEGVGFSILLMNVATPLIDRYTVPTIYGEVQKQHA